MGTSFLATEANAVRHPERTIPEGAAMEKGPVTTPAEGKWLEKYRKHLLDRKYMSGIERDEARVKATAEVFTPDDMVKHLVNKVGEDEVKDPKKRIIDPTCGDGQFLAYILYCRLKAGVPLLDSLRTIFGIEKEHDNVDMCRARLRCGHDDNEAVVKIVNENIFEGDALEYHMRFDGTPIDSGNPKGGLLTIMEHEKPG